MNLGEYRYSLQEAENPTGEIFIWLLLIFLLSFFLYFNCCNYFVPVNFLPLPKVSDLFLSPFLSESKSHRYSSPTYGSCPPYLWWNLATWIRQVWIEPRAAYQVTRGAPFQFSLSANALTVLPFCPVPLPLQLLTSHLNDLYYIITKSYFSKYTDPLLGDICFEIFSPTIQW